MSDYETPVHIGVLEQSGTVDTPKGKKMHLITDQGEFLLTADSKAKMDAFSMAVDMYTRDVVRGETDE